VEEKKSRRTKEERKAKRKELFGKVKQAVPDILDKVGDFLPENGWAGIIKNLIDKDPKIPTATKEQLLKELELEIEEQRIENENTDSARKMQIAALNQDDLFSKRFVYFLTAFWSVVASAYVFFVTFSKSMNQHASDTILGFLLGTIISAIINFYFGSSSGSKDKLKEIMNLKK